MSSGALNLKAHYELQEKIGMGAFGEVFKAVDTRSNEVCAVKIIDLERAGDEIDDEIAVLSQCACEQLTKYIGSFIQGTQLWIIMEYLAGGSVLDVMDSGIHPMKVLFMIPRNDPPVLEGGFSAKFKDFVAQCLRKEPAERPTAAALLEHPFVRSAKHISHLLDLLERNQIAPSDRDDGFASSSIRPGASRSVFTDRDAAGRSSCSSVFGAASGEDDAAATPATAELGHFRSGDASAGEQVEFDQFARNKVHARAKSTNVDSGWDFNTVRISSTASAGSSGIASGALFFPPMLEAADGERECAGISDADGFESGPQAPAPAQQNDEEDEGDTEAFENVVKPAVFGVLSGELDVEDLEDEEALKTREELLLDLLHAFECLTQQS
ncbi:hypothetical protein PybrP1_007238 [[Pythium] brassicae (nom. inval.)]|nr:hypothetical protein PybrP1_007238 [[Pythium] brassicae (nom. inval.)]